MNHRLICCSDTHGAAPPLPDLLGATAFLHGGDFYDGRLLRHAVAKDASTADFDMLRSATDLRWMDSVQVPIYAVKGNHDVADPFGVFHRLTDVTGTVVTIAPNLFVAGLGWNGEIFFELPTETDMYRVCQRVHRTLMRTMGRGDRLILLTHYPGRFPEVYPPTDFIAPAWAEPIRQLVRETNPLVVIQGHHHRDAGLSGVFEYADKRSLILSVGVGGILLEIDMEKNAARVM